VLCVLATELWLFTLQCSFLGLALVLFNLRDHKKLFSSCEYDYEKMSLETPRCRQSGIGIGNRSRAFSLLLH